MNIIVLFLLLSISWAVVTAIYRLSLSPLARFPGPKLAILTGFVETYYDCWKRGRFWVYIAEAHKNYGPIIRISPWELHIDDPDWNDAYRISSRPSKDHWYYAFVGSSGAGFGTSDHEVHRFRRKAQQAYFTQEGVASFNQELSTITSKLCMRLEEHRGTNQPVNLSNAFRSLATDVVTQFCFQKSYDLLDSPDFGAVFQKNIRVFPEIGMWHRHFGVVLDVMNTMPRWLVGLMNPTSLSVVDFFNDIESRSNAIVATHRDGMDVDKAQRNIIHQMLDSPDLPAKDKFASRLALEARTFIGAGTETTGNTLTVTTFHLLSDPAKAERLRNEIQAARRQEKGPFEYSTLLQLPYLTTVSTTQKLIHDNESIFVSPRSFCPERWLDDVERKRLESLAQSELFVTLAMLFGAFDLKLCDTDVGDIEQFHDFFSPFPYTDKGLKVIVT
ncbi:hypothetical protein BP6252_00543 [Coleophoma cylindrospora]|uniref:Cytochrome P450 n=1 Tax=Coleophoma cylindrospora TaxID=1849047 RepID=A0A3D8SQQ1_9HELO|nr:hypothetical protein BP6252_00543 [Coleophoma cylindrospora]